MYALTDAAVKKLKSEDKPYKRADGRGLFLYVTPAGGRHWKYKYRLGGKEQRETLGSYPDVGLAAARDLHAQSRAWVAAGKHPLDERRRLSVAAADASQLTFGVVTNAWMAANRPRWSLYYASQVESFMGRYVSGTELGRLPIRDVTSKQLRELLQSIAVRTELGEGERKDGGSVSIAINVRTWCRGVFDYAQQHEYVDADPTVQLSKLPQLRRPPSAIKHSKALLPKELLELLKALEGFGGNRLTAIALQLLLLTFVRTGELIRATWDEFDFERLEWRIPAARMKAGKAHLVPLSQQALSLLQELQEISGQNRFLFPNMRDRSRSMSATTVNRALERLKFNGKGTIGFSAHGFRATAATRLYEAQQHGDVIELQLAHTERNAVKGAYDHAQHITARFELMQTWADYIDNLRCSSGPAEEVPLG